MPTPNDLRARADWLVAIGEPTRLRLLAALAAGEMSVVELCRACDLEPVSASHHTQLMKAAGLVAAEREGRTTRYRLVGAEVAAGALELAHASGVRVTIPLGDARESGATRSECGGDRRPAAPLASGSCVTSGRGQRHHAALCAATEWKAARPWRNHRRAAAPKAATPPVTHRSNRTATGRPAPTAPSGRRAVRSSPRTTPESGRPGSHPARPSVARRTPRPASSGSSP